MTKQSKRPADITTDRYGSELPILDRLLPLDSIPDGPASIESSDGPAGNQTDIFVESSGPAESAAPATVSMNSQCLEYDQPSIGLSWGRRVLGALLPAAAAAVAVGSMLVPVAAGAQAAPGSGLEVKSVRFDLAGPDSPGPTSYRSMVVTEAGVEHSLEPMAGAVRVTMSEPSAISSAAVLDGAGVAFGDPAFTDSFAAALPSTPRIPL